MDSFLAGYWQRQPLFIPSGLGDFEVPADANELAGLAMEQGPDSRIVFAEGQHWHQERGPFNDASYQRDGSWTLLVQAVDQYWDEAAALLNAVRFLPNWRLDDIMMSYATDGGSAGPHYDNYDVFIIQGDGQRRWQIGDFCDASSVLLDNTDMRLLADFVPHKEYLMNTGDVLYIPPGIAHYGISVGESTSFSIGFRAPRKSDLLARFADNILSTLEDDVLFSDANREPASRRGEITTADLNRAREQLLELLNDKDPRWFGEAVTDGAAVLHDTAGAELKIEEQGSWIGRAPGSRLAWHKEDQELLVFTHGSTHDAPLALQPIVESLCGHEDVAVNDALRIHDAAEGLLFWLYDEGAIIFYD